MKVVIASRNPAKIRAVENAFGLLTNGMYMREGVYTKALVVTLVPFVNGLY